MYISLGSKIASSQVCSFSALAGIMKQFFKVVVPEEFICYSMSYSSLSVLL